MKTPPRTVVVLRSRSQLDVLVSPVRLEILEHFRESTPLSIAGVAERMERPANSITYHVAKLAAAGIIVKTGSRRTSRREEALYALAGREIAIGVNPSSAAAMRAAARSVSTILRLAEREVRRVLTGGCFSGPRPAARPTVRRLKTWLTEEESKVLTRRLDSIQRWLARRARSRRGREHAVTIVVSLLPRRKPS